MLIEVVRGRMDAELAGLAMVRNRFGSPFSSNIVVCGPCFMTLSLTFSETLKWLSSLPVSMQGSF